MPAIRVKASVFARLSSCQAATARTTEPAKMVAASIVWAKSQNTSGWKRTGRMSARAARPVAAVDG